MIGPGKYDDVCSLVREKVGIGRAAFDPSAVIVIVLGGNKGNGFSCQATGAAMRMLPDFLESIAEQICNDQTRMPT